jgi:small multidrug resistance pump
VTACYFALAGGILIGVAGQLLLKLGSGNGGSVLEQFLRPPTVAGLAVYCVAALLYTIALRKIPISIAFASVSVSYILVAGVAHFLFKETLTVVQVGGILMIMAGVALLHHSS